MVHTVVYGSSSITTEFLLNRDWDSIPFLIDLTTDEPFIRNDNKAIEMLSEERMSKNALK